MGILIRILSLACFFCIAASASAQYQAIDRHARKAPDSLRYDLPKLVAYLIEPAETEVERARSLYAWLVHNIAYDEEASAQGRRINQNIGQILRRGRGLCFDYSLLYVELCRQAGLQCLSVSGYSRPGLDSLALPSVPGHSWNALLLDGEWRLVDATWGASPGEDALMAQYNTGYFLTPPRLFILNHLPALPMWQLLPCPVTPEEFSRPAGTLLSLIDGRDSCSHYRDTIAAFVLLGEARQRLLEAEGTYRFHPTPGNRQAWAQAITDQAVYLSEQAGPLQKEDSLEVFLEFQDKAIGYCRKARELAAPLPWQTEFYAGLLVNRAVALNQLSGESDTVESELRQLKDGLKSLREARQVLLTLPEENYYRQYALRQCEAYQEVFEHNIGRLE
ncbi:MAG: hypothetical protein H6560_11025 [Lewinellaceae bacterium]|nr:hypothetical protein [Lewinellaceae bacterium]